MGIFDKQTKSNITFSNVAQEWILYKQPRLKKSTSSYYQYIIDTRLDNILGNEKISKLKDYNFNNITAKIQEKLSKKSTKDTLVVLKAILKYADFKYELGLNMDLITIPKIQTKAIEFFTSEEVEKLENYLIQSDKDIEIGIWFSLYAGLKMGEICALKWENINIKNRTIEIKNVIQSIRKKKDDFYTTFEEINVENEHSRVIPINDKLYDRLNLMKDKNNKNSFILTGNNERIMSPSSYRKIFNRVLKKCEIEQRKYQALRHTFAVNCIKMGMDVENLKDILGHTQLVTTLSTYMQPSVKTKQNYINKLYR